MSLLVRKIEYQKWMQRNIREGESASADAITGCMRTTGNKLSLWSIDDEADLEEAVLAMAASFHRLDTIDVLSIDPSLVEKKGLSLEASKGLTPYAAFRENHRDVVDLDYYSLGAMAEVVIESIQMERKKRFTRSQLKAIVSRAVEVGKVTLSELNKSVQEDIIPNIPRMEGAL